MSEAVNTTFESAVTSGKGRKKAPLKKDGNKSSSAPRMKWTKDKEQKFISILTKVQCSPQNKGRT